MFRHTLKSLSSTNKLLRLFSNKTIGLKPTVSRPTTHQEMPSRDAVLTEDLRKNVLLSIAAYNQRKSLVQQPAYIELPTSKAEDAPCPTKLSR